MSRNGYSSPSYRSTDRDDVQPLTRGDATVDIPLDNVNNGYQSQTLRNPAASSAMNVNENEKQGFLQRRGVGVRKSIAAAGARRPNTGFDDEEDMVTGAGRLYHKILNFSTFTRYFIYILPLAAILAVPIVVGATAARHARIDGVRMMWLFVWLLTSWVGLWTAKVVAHYLPVVFRGLCGVVTAGTRKYELILKNLEIPLSLCGWALVSLATFRPFMNLDSTATDGPPWAHIVQQILAALMISALVYTGECLFIQIISINYHRKQFHSKLKDHKRTLYLLGLLYNASCSMFPSFCAEFAEEDAIIKDLIDLSFGRKRKKEGRSHNRSGSSTPGRVLQDISNLGDKVTAAFGQVANEVTGKQVVNAHSSNAVVMKALEKNRSSEALARRLWLSFVVEGHEALYQEDIVEVLGPGRRAEAEECFALLDADGNGDVSLDEMILTVAQFGRDRSSIANSMHDVDQAIKVLDRMLCAVIFIIVIFIFIAFLNKSFVTTLATAGTALLSLSFVFSTTAQEVLGSCIFLFVKHPYDIGDRVDLNSGTDKMVVEHISLLFTVFRRIDTHRTVQIPNIVLNSIWVENVSRSNAMKESLSLFVAFDTSLADIQLLRTEMKKFVTDKENSRDFQDDINIEVLGVHEMNKLELSIDIQHKSNWSNETVRAARRSKFMCALVLALRKVPIYGPGGGDPGLGSPGNPSYSVSVSDVEAANARAKAAEAKEATRLVPTKKPEVDKLADTLGAPSELRVVTSLNERSPALDGARDAGSLRVISSPTSPRGIEALDQADGEGNELVRQTTSGRRKSGKTGDVESGLGFSGAEIPSIGVTAPTPRTGGGGDFYANQQATQSPDGSMEEWYGRNEEAQGQQQQMSQYPRPPPAPAQLHGQAAPPHPHQPYGYQGRWQT